MPDGTNAPALVHLHENDIGIFFLSLTLLIAFWVGAFGWGRAFARFFPVPLLRLNSISAVVGLGILNVIGGWLNLAKLATAPFLIALMVAGLLFAGMNLRRTRPWMQVLARLQNMRQGNGPDVERPAYNIFWPVLIALALSVIAAALLIPSSAFNVFDDFYAYLPRVIRMIQTGTLAGNPLDAIGIDSLGSQAFFQGFFLPAIDVRMLQAFDAVGCFTLALLTVAELALFWRMPVLVGMLAVITTAAINPQCVNLSPVYSGVVVMVTLVAAGTTWAGSLVSCRLQKRYGHECVLGLLAALLITLKLTLAISAIFYLSILLVATWCAGANRKVLGKSVLVLVVTTTASVTPWLLLHWPGIYHARNLAAPFREGAFLANKYHGTLAHEIPRLFSLSPLFLGGSLAAYHLVALACLGTGLVAWWVWRRKPLHRRPYGLLSAGAAGAAALAIYLSNAHLFLLDDAVRYSCPALIACFITGMLCLLKFSRGDSTRARQTMTLGVCGVMVVVSAIFGSSLKRRIALAASARASLAFPVAADYVPYCVETLSVVEALHVRGWQEMMEPRATVLVWVAAPFHFDFTRNRMLVMTEQLLNPAIAFPAGINTDAFRLYLGGYGVRYVLLQQSGRSIKNEEFFKNQLESRSEVYRKLADYNLYLRHELTNLAAQSKVLRSNDNMVLFDITERNDGKRFPVR